MEGEFGAVVLDPPWLERGGGQYKRGADRHYTLMKTPEIVDLLTSQCEPLERMADNSAAFLWTTNNFLRDGLDVLEAIGFRYVTALTWAKPSFGLGYYFRGQTEHVLFGVRGKLGRPPGTSSTLLGGGILDRPGGHSAKPDELQAMIEERFSGPYLEIFAREARDGWTSWGNETETETPWTRRTIEVPRGQNSISFACDCDPPISITRSRRKTPAVVGCSACNVETEIVFL